MLGVIPILIQQIGKKSIFGSYYFNSSLSLLLINFINPKSFLRVSKSFKPYSIEYNNMVVVVYWYYTRLWSVRRGFNSLLPPFLKEVLK